MCKDILAELAVPPPDRKPESALAYILFRDTGSTSRLPAATHGNEA